MSYFFAESGSLILGKAATMESFNIGDLVTFVGDDDGLLLEIIAISEYDFYASEAPLRTRFCGVEAACLITEGIQRGSNGMALAVPGHLLYLEEHEMKVAMPHRANQSGPALDSDHKKGD